MEIHMRIKIGLLITLATSTSLAQTMNVEIVDRADKQSSYSYVVPGYSTQNSTGNVNCFGSANLVNCNGSTTSITTSTPSLTGTYQVTGATLTLKLTDGRLVVVNCNAKINWTEWTEGAYRSCRVPLVTNVEADFKGDKAKLKWTVSLDGKKKQTESYKILGIFDPPKN